MKEKIHLKQDDSSSLRNNYRQKINCFPKSDRYPKRCVVNHFGLQMLCFVFHKSVEPIFLSPCTIFLPKLLHNSNKSRTFASTELVCIPLELQASHFFIINYESESKNNSAADSHTQIKRDGFQRRKPRHLISDKNQLFPSKVLLDGYD